ncbi:facilitated trehalose transporter Tret1-2 homolog [Schistocerca serialis cubense]|uniref:facilitated trehalose transporter Tret1-2 homolog n=1 Tax=Schistocerca serialis cubense TaxID=2023355 RepID=UPI00214F2A85|nr:facilitated trehalose transporter Tret1-2 homolog [Schistocerca serialis cubense]
MRTHAKKWCSVADDWGVNGIFRTTASGWPSLGPVSSGKAPAGGPKEADTWRSTWPQFLAAAVVNLNSFAVGTHFAWTAMALPQLMSAESGLRAQPLTADQASWVASLLTLGGLCVLPLFAALSSHVDRKTLGYLAAPLQLAACVVLISSTEVAALYTARFLASVHGTCAVLLVTLYVGETASDGARGALGCVLSLLCNCGILCGYVLGACLSYRAVLYANMAPLLLYVICFPFVPETPYRLASTGRHQDARKALRWLRRGISDEEVERQMACIQTSLETGGSNQGGGDRRPLCELLRCRATLVAVAIVLLLFLNQQFCGTLCVNSYAVFIFDEAGGSLSPEVATIILGVLQVVGGLLSAPLVDRMGRRPTLFLSNAAVGASVAVMGVYLYLKAETQADLSSIGWLPVSCLSVYVVMVAFGLAALPYVVIAEIVPPRIRGLIATCGYFVICFTGGTMAKLYPLMSESMGTYGTFWFFAAVCALSTLIAWFVLPETKGRPIEDILRELNGGKDVYISST